MGGTLFVGKCRCGYQSPFLYQGYAPDANPPITEIPVECLECGAVYLGDTQTPNGIACDQCHSTDVLPMGRLVHSERFRWQTWLIPGPFRCPECRRWTMYVQDGQWD